MFLHSFYSPVAVTSSYFLPCEYLINNRVLIFDDVSWIVVSKERNNERKSKLRGRTSEEGLNRGKREIQRGSNREEEEGD